jgi:hypothetical protein
MVISERLEDEARKRRLRLTIRILSDDGPRIWDDR